MNREYYIKQYTYNKDKFGVLEQYIILKVISKNKHLTRYKLRQQLSKYKELSLPVSQFYRLMRYFMLNNYIVINKDYTCEITEKGLNKIQQLELRIKKELL
jgi:hypothetical protein